MVILKVYVMDKVFDVLKIDKFLVIMEIFVIKIELVDDMDGDFLFKIISVFSLLLDIEKDLF